jgi:hypothetical protein
MYYCLSGGLRQQLRQRLIEPHWLLQETRQSLTEKDWTLWWVPRLRLDRMKRGNIPGGSVEEDVIEVGIPVVLVWGLSALSLERF